MSDRYGFLPPYKNGAVIHKTASVGAPGEDKRKPDVDCCPNKRVAVGEKTVIREFVTVHGGFEAMTTIGANCYVMAHSHIGHDCQLGDDVTIATGALLGGHTHVHKGANVGMGAMVHQKLTIGAYAMVGMGSVVTHDIPPYTTWYGNPARQHGFNRVGMERAGLSTQEIFEIEHGKRTEWHKRFDQEKGRR